MTAPALIVRRGADGTPYFEAKWRPAGKKPIKRRLGRAWVVFDADQRTWRKRSGRTPEGWLDEPAAHVAAATKVSEVGEELRDRDAQAVAAQIVTVRQLAAEFLLWREKVAGAAPSTLADDESVLAEPGSPFKRGRGRRKGRVMSRLGDRPFDRVTAREIAALLTWLDEQNLSARTVNKTRALLHAMWAYAMKPDTFGLEQNPVSGTDARYEEPPPPLDFYEVEEVEALAQACERGSQRGRPRTYRGRLVAVSDAEEAARHHEDQQDADFFRVKFYSGMRLGEIVVLQVESVQFLPDLSGAVIQVERALSAGKVKRFPKGRRRRTVPLPRAGAMALWRTLQRTEFTSGTDYVFCNRLGERLDPSAIRRRYKRALAAAELRPLTLHHLRHSAGSVMARRVPLVNVRDILGHAKLSTTNRYLHSKIDDSLIAAVNDAFTPPHGVASAA